MWLPVLTWLCESCTIPVIHRAFRTATSYMQTTFSFFRFTFICADRCSICYAVYFRSSNVFFSDTRHVHTQDQTHATAHQRRELPHHLSDHDTWNNVGPKFSFHANYIFFFLDSHVSVLIVAVFVMQYIPSFEWTVVTMTGWIIRARTRYVGLIRAISTCICAVR